MLTHSACTDQFRRANGDADSYPESVSKPEPEPDPDCESEPESFSDPEPDPDSEPDSEPEVVTGPKLWNSWLLWPKSFQTSGLKMS